MTEQTVITLDSQQLSTFAACKRKYFHSFIENIERKPFKDVTGLSKGAFLHTLFEKYNERILKDMKHQEALQATIFEGGINQNLDTGTRLLLIKRFIEYFNYWNDVDYELVSNEEGFSKILYSDPEKLFIYEGRMDAVYFNKREKKFVWRDYKSHSGHFIYEHNNQFLGYTWAIQDKERPARGEIDYISTSKYGEGDKLFIRKLIDFSDQQIELWKQDAIEIFEDVYRVKKYNRNLTQCQSKFGICQYSQLCERDPSIHTEIKKMYYQEKEEWRAW